MKLKLKVTLPEVKTLRAHKNVASDSVLIRGALRSRRSFMTLEIFEMGSSFPVLFLSPYLSSLPPSKV